MVRHPCPLPCPNCGASNARTVTAHKRGPRIINDKAVRGHECRACGHLFITVQRIATADELLEVVA